MKLPDLGEYRAVVQAPQLAFTDRVLQSGQAETNPLGLPLAITGGFALTFKIRSAGQVYAVRCFHKEGNRLQDRYQQICTFVRDRPHLRFLLDVDYNPGGIQVGENRYPIVTMPWIEGATLDEWVDDNVGDASALKEVRRNISTAVLALREAGVAHGDLQHGNILVLADRSIRLVDYDGMYLPGLRDFGPADQGHRNYQHPGRDQAFDATIDEFSRAVVGLSLAALEHEPELWDRYSNSQNLLLSSDDFADPDASEVFARLCALEPVAEYAHRLRAACKTEFSAVPEVIAGKRVRGRAAARPTRKPHGSEVLHALDADALRARQGEEVTVFGKVTSTKVHDRSPTIHINFGDFRRADFTVVSFERRVRGGLFDKFGADLNGLEGIWVSLNGMVELYQSQLASEPTPQIVLRQIRALRQLSPAEVEELATAAERGSHAPDEERDHLPEVDEVPSAPDAAGKPEPNDAAGPPRVRGTGDVDDFELRLSRLYSSPDFSQGAPNPSRSFPPPTRSNPATPPPVPPSYRVERLPGTDPAPARRSAPAPPPPASRAPDPPPADQWPLHRACSTGQPPPPSGPPPGAGYPPPGFGPGHRESKPSGLFQRMVDFLNRRT
ncbi:hypothetical protein AB0L88_09365 [Saccharopolyspora shandongensis]|uniref:hypothetical protein n=1 Tax=Saccharopolyspora shandongensis TaxID=418495 RepID=UPI003442854A